MAGRAKRTGGRNDNNGSTLAFEQTLRLAADKLRNNIYAAEYRTIVLGLTFRKNISPIFETLVVLREPCV
jgi:type I restriction enzyme M protein